MHLVGKKTQAGNGRHGQEGGDPPSDCTSS
jgi:hypothetical protein